MATEEPDPKPEGEAVVIAVTRIYNEARTLAHGKEGWDAFYALLEAELRAAYRQGEEAGRQAIEALDFIRNHWSPVRAPGCPACVYENGRFIRCCQLHLALDAAESRARIAEAVALGGKLCISVQHEDLQNRLAAAESRARAAEDEQEILRQARNGANLERAALKVNFDKQAHELGIAKADVDFWCRRADDIAAERNAAESRARTAEHRYELLVKAAKWATEEDIGPIHDFERELTQDPVMHALGTLSDMRRCCWEPVSDYLHVSCYEEVLPAVRALAGPTRKDTPPLHGD